MKIIKSPEHGLIYKSFGLKDRIHLSLGVMVYFDLNGPEVLSEQDMWTDLAPILPPGLILDTGMPKARGEVLVQGSCHAPRGRQIQGAAVSLRAGGLHKRLLVFGDRYWKRGVITKPLSFSEMPLTWDKAFGGRNYERNPLGKGAEKIMTPSGEVVHPLPNIEDPDNMVLDASMRPDPAGVGPIDITWPQRRKKEGTYDKKWQMETSPDLPADTLETLLNAAPENQWLKGFFKPGDILGLENMHPDFSNIASSLPKLRLRFFLTQRTSLKRTEDEKLVFKEIENKIDTVWLFPSILRGVAIFRGVTEILDDEYADVIRIYTVTENFEDQPKTLEYYEEEEKKLLDRSVPLDPAPFEKARVKVAEMLKKIKGIPQQVAEAKKRALGKAPVMKYSPAELGNMKDRLINQGLAAVNRGESLARAMLVEHGHLVKIDLDKFARVRGKLEAAKAKMDEAVSKGQEALAQKDKIIKDLGKHFRESLTPEQLAEKNIDPDDPLPWGRVNPWHDRGFPLVVKWRKNLEFDEQVRARLLKLGLNRRSLKRSWVGWNPEPFNFIPEEWGLSPDEFEPTEIPAGWVIPHFDGPVLDRIAVRPEWNEEAVDLPGSSEEPWAHVLEGQTPLIRVGDELEAILVRQEVGDAVNIVVLEGPDQKPGPEAEQARERAEVLLVLLPEESGETRNEAEKWTEKHDLAQPHFLPKGQNLFEAREKGVDIREWIMSALPAGFQKKHNVQLEMEPGKPADAAMLASLTWPTFDISGLLKSFTDEIKALHQPALDAAEAQKKDALKQADMMMASVEGAKPAPVPDAETFSMLEQTKANLEHMRQQQAKLGKTLPPEKRAEFEAKAREMEDLAKQYDSKTREAKAKLEAAQKMFQEKKARAKARQLPPKAAAKFRELGIDPADYKKLTREEVEARLAERLPLARADMSDLDLSGLDFSGYDLSGCRAMKTKFAGADLSGTDLTGLMANSADFSQANLQKAVLTKSVLTKAGLKQADLTGAELSRTVMQGADLGQADLTGAVLNQTMLEKAILVKADLTESRLSMTILTEADLSGAILAKARMEKCLFQGSIMDQADLSHSFLSGCLLQKASGQNVVFKGAVMHGSGVMQSVFPQVDFQGADLSGSFFKDSNFTGGVFSHGKLDGALFDSCEMDQADLSRSTARKTRLVKSNLEGADLTAVNLFSGSLRKTRLVEAKLTASNLYGVDFYKAEVGQTKFEMSNLKKTGLEGRTDLI